MRSRHILVAVGLGQGHLQPHLAVAQALRDKGHRVTVYAEAAGGRYARLAGCHFEEMPTGKALRGMHSARTTAQYRKVCADLAGLVAPHLLGVLKARKIDAAVVDGLHLGAALAAEKYGLPWATLATTPAFLSPESASWAQATLPTAPLRRRLGLPPTSKNSLEQSISDSLLLLPWTEDFDLSQPSPQSVHVGPLNWDAPARAAPASIRRLRRVPPVVLVSVSTIPFEGLAGLVNHYVGEAIEALNQLPVQGLLTLPSAEYSIHVAPAPHVRIEEFIPHGVIMNRLAAIVTHGGWGTVGRALTAGVPLVVVPFALDQPVVGRICQRAGVGFTLPVQRMTARTLKDRLQRVLSSAVIRRNARRMSEKLSRLQASSTSAQLVLERCVT